MPKKLSYKTFIKTFKYAPRIAICLLIEDDQNGILLSKRAIPPLKDFWHLPGAFLLKGESLNECLIKVAKEELGLAFNIKNAKLLGVFEDMDKDPRGHIIDIIYGDRFRGRTVPKQGRDSKEVKFFKKLPAKVDFNHRETLNKLGYK